MKKIIITFITTIVLIVPFEKTQGQTITSTDFPRANATIGATAGVSLSIWRLELFLVPSFGLIQVGYGLQVFEERMTIKDSWGVSYEYYLPRFSSAMSFRLGYLGFKITGRDIVRAGISFIGTGVLDGNNSRAHDYLFLEYVHTRCLSQRISLDLSVGVGYSLLRGLLDGSSIGTTSDFNIDMSSVAIEFGGRLNFEILRNLNFGIRLGYTARFVGDVSGVENPEMFRNNFTRNFLDVSVGLHYRMHILSPFAMRCRQNVRRQQMRNQRSWGRPSPVFNHPTRR